MEWLPKIKQDTLKVSLQQPVSEGDIAEYRRKIKLSRWALGFDFVALDTLLVVGGFIVLGGVMPVVISHTLPRVGSGLLFLALGLLAATVVWRASQRAIRRHIRLSKFAAAHNLHYDPAGKEGAIGTGLIFDIGHSRMYRGVMSYEHGGKRMLEIGRYQYTKGHGKHQHTYYWWYAAVRMARSLPHMVLDATQNNARLFGSNLPVLLPGSQRISLEGDFDTHFTLYAPKQYDVDARYVFTPDVMAALVDSSANFDAEIIDDVVFFYTPDKNQPDEEALGQLFAVLDVVGRELYDQTDLYADDRVADARRANIVAEQGRRLKKWRIPGI
ncbi:MAG: hypothetical protein Q4A37_00270 [Candidatus Saccharibacteria bacterium]|nr:hypothetical protein [Candidatus Saccharibacteria bacterium]